MGNQRVRLAQAKSQLAEQTLALPHSQRHTVFLFHIGRQQFAVPEVALQAGVPRRQPQGSADQLELLIAPPGRPIRMSSKAIKSFIMNQLQLLPPFSPRICSGLCSAAGSVFWPGVFPAAKGGQTEHGGSGYPGQH
jgi:hypothetical protein